MTSLENNVIASSEATWQYQEARVMQVVSPEIATPTKWARNDFVISHQNLYIISAYSFAFLVLGFILIKTLVEKKGR